MLLLLKIMCTRPRPNVSFLTSLWPRHQHITILYNIGLHYCANTRRKRSRGDVWSSHPVELACAHCWRYHLTLQLQLTRAQLPQLLGRKPSKISPPPRGPVFLAAPEKKQHNIIIYIYYNAHSASYYVEHCSSVPSAIATNDDDDVKTE